MQHPGKAPMSATHISVRGTHTVERAPDLGTVTFIVRVERDDAEDCQAEFEEITEERAEEHQQLLTDGAIIDVRHSSRLCWRAWVDGSPSFVRAQRHELTFVDLEVMSAFIHRNPAGPRLIDPTATVRLSPDTAGLLMSQTRRAAADDAALRARDFADTGAQLTLISLRELWDTDTTLEAAWAGADMPTLRVTSAVEATYAVNGTAAPPTSPA